jgi:DNA-binding CsgD family transcriptional regulator
MTVPLSTAPARPASARELQSLMHAERAGVPFVVLRDGEDKQIFHALPASVDRFTVGRHSTSDVPLYWDQLVSRSHAVLERIGRDWTLVDDGLSRNGSFVNGDRISGRTRLTDGDTLRFGTTLVIFRAPVASTAAGVTAVDDDALLTVDALTPMQRKVLAALCRPLSGNRFATPATNQDIADELVLSVEAIKTHMRGLFERFGVEHLPQNQKRARVVELAFQSGLVTERDL